MNFARYIYLSFNQFKVRAFLFPFKHIQNRVLKIKILK